MNTGRIQRRDEAAIRQVGQIMQDGQNTKDGARSLDQDGSPLFLVQENSYQR
jgi:hypothetical protein